MICSEDQCTTFRLSAFLVNDICNECSREICRLSAFLVNDICNKCSGAATTIEVERISGSLSAKSGNWPPNCWSINLLTLLFDRQHSGLSHPWYQLVAQMCKIELVIFSVHLKVCRSWQLAILYRYLYCCSLKSLRLVE